MISTKGRYAVRIMLALCEDQSGGYVSLKSIAEDEGISEKYMESITSMLVKEGFVEGIRGKGGGSPEMLQGSCSASRQELEHFWEEFHG